MAKGVFRVLTQAGAKAKYFLFGETEPQLVSWDETCSRMFSGLCFVFSTGKVYIPVKKKYEF